MRCLSPAASVQRLQKAQITKRAVCDGSFLLHLQPFGPEGFGIQQQTGARPARQGAGIEQQQAVVLQPVCRMGVTVEDDLCIRLPGGQGKAVQIELDPISVAVGQKDAPAAQLQQPLLRLAGAPQSQLPQTL